MKFCRASSSSLLWAVLGAFLLVSRGRSQPRFGSGQVSERLVPVKGFAEGSSCTDQNLSDLRLSRCGGHGCELPARGGGAPTSPARRHLRSGKVADSFRGVGASGAEVGGSSVHLQGLKSRRRPQASHDGLRGATLRGPVGFWGHFHVLKFSTCYFLCICS